MGLSGTMVVNEKHEVEMALSKWDVKSDDVSAYWEDTANKFSFDRTTANTCFHLFLCRGGKRGWIWP